MDLIPFIIGLSCIIAFMLLLKLLEGYLQEVFAANSSRQTHGYQGGEVIQSMERRYRSDEFKLIIYFAILHVIGFFAASIYILIKNGIMPVNWTTIGFGAIVFYSILLVSRVEVT